MSSPPIEPTPLTGTDARPDEPPSRPSAGKSGWLARTLNALMRVTLAVADADPGQIEASARQLGESRRFLAPIAWAAGAIVLLLRGIKLLILNWRLTLIELVPAAWIWIVMWDLKQHTLRGEPFRQVTVGGVALIVMLTIAASVAAYWCNTVFAFAVSEVPPRIGPAARQARPYLARITRAGAIMGVVLALGAVVVPRIERPSVYVLALGGLYALMLTSFVAVPARIMGVQKRKLPLTETIGHWGVSGALSAVAMAPGFVLDRIGLILLGVTGFRLLGFVLLSVGTALYAAGMSSVKAVKLTMKLDGRPPQRT